MRSAHHCVDCSLFSVHCLPLMQFQVPQFIEVEDKIFGPLTFKQFVYLAGGVGAAYLLWRLLPLVIAAPLIAIVVGFAAALAFFKYNGQPFIASVENAFFFLLHPRLYLWNNERKMSKQKTVNREQAQQRSGEIYVPRLSDSRLHELAWSLDIKERIAAGTADEEERTGGHERPDAVLPIRTARNDLYAIKQLSSR